MDTLTGSLGMVADHRLVVLRTSSGVAVAAVAAVAVAVAAAAVAVAAAGSAGVAAAVGPRSLVDRVGTVAVLAPVVVAGSAAAAAAAAAAVVAVVFPSLCTSEPGRDIQTRSHPRFRQECPGTCTARSSRTLIFYLCDLVL